jgi:hypothetical protein
LFESFIGNFSPKRLKNESFIESFISIFLLVQVHGHRTGIANSMKNQNRMKGSSM